MEHQKEKSLWGWAAMGALGVFIVGIITAVVLMVSHSVPLVADDYYAREIAFQSQIDKESNTQKYNRVPVLRVDEQRKALFLQIPGEAPLTGKMTFFRPSDPDQDYDVSLNPDADRSMTMDLSHMRAGLWIVQLDWKEAGLAYYYEQKVKL